jgi:hypothetical protein
VRLAFSYAPLPNSHLHTHQYSFCAIPRTASQHKVAVIEYNFAHHHHHPQIRDTFQSHPPPVHRHCHPPSSAPLAPLFHHLRRHHLYCVAPWLPLLLVLYRCRFPSRSRLLRNRSWTMSMLLHRHSMPLVCNKRYNSLSLSLSLSLADTSSTWIDRLIVQPLRQQRRQAVCWKRRASLD